MIFVGDFVMLTEEAKRNFIALGNQAHVDEFGDCVGVVESEGKLVLNVRWAPSDQQFAYKTNWLVRV